MMDAPDIKEDSVGSIYDSFRSLNYRKILSSVPPLKQHNDKVPNTP